MGDDLSVDSALSYALGRLSVRTVAICGHSGCGAVRALIKGGFAEDQDLGRWLSQSGVDLSDCDDEERCVTANVAQQLVNLRTYPVVRNAEAEGRLTLTGLYFDLAEARMYTVDPGRGTREPLPVNAT